MIFPRNLRISLDSQTKIKFVFIKLFVSSTHFLRGFVFMSFLSFHDLGIITLVRTVMGLFPMLQVGMLNGGFRIFSVDNPDKWKVKDTIYSYFAIIGIILLLGLIVAYMLNKLDHFELIYAITALFIGILHVLNIWNRNMLVAQKRFKHINMYELYSNLLSLGLLFTVYFWGVYGALIVIYSQELLFYFFVVSKNRKYLPDRFFFRFKVMKWILTFGFFPFLAGIVMNLNQQVETWSIVSFLTTEDLGKFYLARLYISLFLITPVAVSRLFFPESMQAFSKGNFDKVRNIMKKYFLVNLVYGIVAAGLTMFFISTFVELVIPKHLIGVPYVYLILPGLLVYTVLQPINIVFNGAVKLIPFLWASGLAVFTSSIVLLLTGFLGDLSLEIAAISKSILFLLNGCIIFGIYLVKKDSLWKVNSKLEKLSNSKYEQ
jgi:O-antigen/teichoic acid export membrane protein